MLTDTENLIVVRFEQHKFNETQKVSVLSDSRFNPMTSETVSSLAKIMREMADWLRSNHYNIAMPPI